MDCTLSLNAAMKRWNAQLNIYIVVFGGGAQKSFIT